MISCSQHQSSHFCLPVLSTHEDVVHSFSQHPDLRITDAGRKWVADVVAEHRVRTRAGGP